MMMLVAIMWLSFGCLVGRKTKERFANRIAERSSQSEEEEGKIRE